MVIDFNCMRQAVSGLCGRCEGDGWEVTPAQKQRLLPPVAGRTFGLRPTPRPTPNPIPTIRAKTTAPIHHHFRLALAAGSLACKASVIATREYKTFSEWVTKSYFMVKGMKTIKGASRCPSVLFAWLLSRLVGQQYLKQCTNIICHAVCCLQQTLPELPSSRPMAGRHALDVIDCKTRLHMRFFSD